MPRMILTDYIGIFGDEEVEAREAALVGIGDFLDAIDEAVNELHDHIMTVDGPDASDIEEEVMEWTQHYKTINTWFFEAWKKEKMRVRRDNEKRDKDILEADYPLDERKDARLGQ